MPTRPASMATAPCMRSASDASALSASGSPLGDSVLIEVGLQNELRSDAVAQRPLLERFHARRGQRFGCRSRGVTLVGQRYGDAESPFELACEAARPRRELVFRAIGVRRQA